MQREEGGSALSRTDPGEHPTTNIGQACPGLSLSNEGQAGNIQLRGAQKSKTGTESFSVPVFAGQQQIELSRADSRVRYCTRTYFSGLRSLLHFPGKDR